MNYIILLFGVLIALGGVVLLVTPETVFNLFRKHADSAGLHLFAVIGRIVVGIVLIVGAPGSRFPVALQVLGWISIAAALTLGAIGRARFRRLIQWALELAPLLKSLAGCLAILFGGFLVYAVI